MAITLDTTSKTFELTTSSTADTDYFVSWVDMTTSAFTPGASQGTINTAGTTVLVAAPAASTQRGIKAVSVFNRHASTAQTVADRSRNHIAMQQKPSQIALRPCRCS